MWPRTYATLWLALIVLLLTVLYVGISRTDVGNDKHHARVLTYELVIGEPYIGESVPRFKAAPGDRITFRIRTDRAGQLNVHGIEKGVELTPGAESQLTFSVEVPGTFPVHLHEEVHPEPGKTEIFHHHLAVIEVQRE